MQSSFITIYVPRAVGWQGGKCQHSSGILLVRIRLCRTLQGTESLYPSNPSKIALVERLTFKFLLIPCNTKLVLYQHQRCYLGSYRG